MARFNRGFYLKFKCETFGGEEVTLQVNTTKQAHYHDVLDKEGTKWGFYQNKVRPKDGKKYQFLVSAEFDDDGDTTNNLEVDVFDPDLGVSPCFETITGDKIVIWNVK